MPHIHIEYSGNLDEALDMTAFCEAIRKEASYIEAFPLAGLRVRATRVDHFAIADGASKHAFLDMLVRLREGRPSSVKEQALNSLFEASKRLLAPAMETRSVALSLEMRDIDAELSRKHGTVRDHMKVEI